MNVLLGGSLKRQTHNPFTRLTGPKRTKVIKAVVETSLKKSE